jgi:DNA polymerase III delta prime subunit
MLLLAAEITERPVERDRVVATFQAKIAPQGIEDYLFFVKNAVAEDVMRQARQYFAQGHEVNFLDMRNWLKTILATIGRAGRDVFNRVVVEKLQGNDIPAALKVAWNDQIAEITAGQ